MVDSTCVRVHQHVATGKRGDRGRWWHGTFPRRAYEQNPTPSLMPKVARQPAADRRKGRRLHPGRCADDNLGEGNILLATKGYDTDAFRPSPHPLSGIPLPGYSFVRSPSPGGFSPADHVRQ